MGSLGFALWVVGIVLGRLIHTGSRWGSLGSSKVVEFTRVRAGVVGFIRGRWVHSGSRWGSLGSSGVVGFTRVHSGRRWVHPVWCGSLGFALGVVGFIRGH